jgi:hypothetical protein
MKTQLVEQQSVAPTRKVGAQAIGASLATLAAYGVWLKTGHQMPPGVEGAMATMFGLALGYFVKDRANV